MAGIVVQERTNSFFVQFNDYDTDIIEAYYPKSSLNSVKQMHAGDISISLQSGELYKIPKDMFANFLDVNNVSIIPNGSTIADVTSAQIVQWIAEKAGM